MKACLQCGQIIQDNEICHCFRQDPNRSEIKDIQLKITNLEGVAKKKIILQPKPEANGHTFQEIYYGDFTEYLIDGVVVSKEIYYSYWK